MAISDLPNGWQQDMAIGGIDNYKNVDADLYIVVDDDASGTYYVSLKKVTGLVGADTMVTANFQSKSKADGYAKRLMEDYPK